MDWWWRSQNWPPWSLDLHPLDYHVCGYGVCTEGEHERRTTRANSQCCRNHHQRRGPHKVNTREELPERILRPARNIDNAAVLRKVTSSLVTRVSKCIQADGGHFQQSVSVLNGESVTVHLTIYLNKCTMLYFPF